MSDLGDQARELYNSLDEYKATDIPGKTMGDMYDVIVRQAQEELPDNRIIAGLQTGRRSTIGRPMDPAGDMRAVMQQILTALGDGGPFIG